MGERKLTEAQERALRAMPVTIVMWGGKPFSGMPQGIKSRATLNALWDRDLIAVKYFGNQQNWSITPAGRALLAQEEKP